MDGVALQVGVETHGEVPDEELARLRHLQFILGDFDETLFWY
jgi:hypothetical protein